MEMYDDRLVIERHRENLLIKYLTDKGYYYVIHSEYWVDLKDRGSSNLSDKQILELYKTKIENYLNKRH